MQLPDTTKKCLLEHFSASILTIRTTGEMITLPVLASLSATCYTKNYLYPIQKGGHHEHHSTGMLCRGGGASELFQGIPGSETDPARSQPSDSGRPGGSGRVQKDFPFFS